MSLKHTVQAGETLWSISLLYGVTLEELRAANGLAGDVIYPGQELSIPTTGENGEAEPEPVVPTATLPSLEGGFPPARGQLYPAGSGGYRAFGPAGLCRSPG